MFTSGFNANHLNFLLEGALWTVVLSLISFIGGGLGGALVALAQALNLTLRRTVG